MYIPALDGRAGVAGVGVGAAANGGVVGAGIVVSVVVCVIVCVGITVVVCVSVVVGLVVTVIIGMVWYVVVQVLVTIFVVVVDTEVVVVVLGKTNVSGTSTVRPLTPLGSSTDRSKSSFPLYDPDGHMLDPSSGGIVIVILACD